MNFEEKIVGKTWKTKTENYRNVKKYYKVRNREREKIDKHVEIEKKCNPTKSEIRETLLKTEKSINSEKFGNQKIKKRVIFGIAKKNRKVPFFNIFVSKKGMPNLRKKLRKLQK